MLAGDTTDCYHACHCVVISPDYDGKQFDHSVVCLFVCLTRFPIQSGTANDQGFYFKLHISVVEGAITP